MERWPPLIGGVLLNLALGAFYAWSVFVLPLEKAFGWSRQQTSWVFTIAVIATVASFVLGGRMQDTRGPRLCGVIGATLVGLGFSLASLTTSLALLYTAFGCVVGVGNGIGYAAPMPVASKWFPDRRGLAVGLTAAGYGAGPALIGPLATALIDQLGWRVTCRVLGLVLCAVGLTGAWLMHNPPPGFAVAGPGRRDFSTREMVSTPTFYALWMAYGLGATAGLMTISQLVPFARGAGLSAMAATFALTVSAVGDASGRVLSGWLSDALGRVTTLRAAVLGSALAMPALPPLAVVTRPCGASLRPPAAGMAGMVPVARGGRWRSAGTRRREGGQVARHRVGARGQWKRPFEFPILTSTKCATTLSPLKVLSISPALGHIPAGLPTRSLASSQSAMPPRMPAVLDTIVVPRGSLNVTLAALPPPT